MKSQINSPLTGFSASSGAGCAARRAAVRRLRRRAAVRLQGRRCRRDDTSCLRGMHCRALLFACMCLSRIENLLTVLDDRNNFRAVETRA
jgi:hypothetical protein